MFMKNCKIKIPAIILNRGFWIYVVQIIDSENQKYYYVGMTGDTSSFNAAALFVRLGRHLDTKEKAKGNTLFRAIKKEGLNLDKLDFEIMGFYLAPENKQRHRKIREEIAILEDRLHKDLKLAGYNVLGTHWPKKESIVPKHREKDYSEIINLVKENFKK